MSVLRGKTILLTRSAEENEQDSLLLRGLGASTLSLPMMRFADPDSWEECDNAIASLNAYHGVLFTSKKAVSAFLGRIASISPSAKEILVQRVVYAVGERTREALEEQGIPVAASPDFGGAENLAEVLGTDVAGRSFLFPKSSIARDVLPAALRANNASVDEVTVYKTLPPVVTDLENVRNSLLHGRVDAVLFFSPSAVLHFVQIIGTRHARSSVVAAIGPTTAASARRAGFTVSAVAEKPSMESLITALERILELKATS